MKNSNAWDGDGPLHPIKPLPGTKISGPKWALVPPGVYLVEPKDWQPKLGPNGPIGWLITTIVKPPEVAGTDIAWFCNIDYDKASGEFILAHNSKVSRTARRLFPDDIQYCDPPLGRLLEHYLCVEVVTADKSRVGGKVTPKPLERQYSKISKILASGPRIGQIPPSDQDLREMEKLLQECERGTGNDELGIGNREW